MDTSEIRLEAHHSASPAVWHPWASPPGAHSSVQCLVVQRPKSSLGTVYLTSDKCQSSSDVYDILANSISLLVSLYSIHVLLYCPAIHALHCLILFCTIFMSYSIVLQYMQSIVLYCLPYIQCFVLSCSILMSMYMCYCICSNVLRYITYHCISQYLFFVCSVLYPVLGYLSIYCIYCTVLYTVFVSCIYCICILLYALYTALYPEYCYMLYILLCILTTIICYVYCSVS